MRLVGDESNGNNQLSIMAAMFHNCLLFLCCLSVASHITAVAGDQPQWGEAWSRNMVSKETNLPEFFDPETGSNIAWTAELGTETHSTPVIAGGRVYIGTNNGHPRDPRHDGDRGVLMCFDEGTGRFLWQLVVPKREDDPYYDWPKSGIASPATVESNRVYLVSNRGEVMCLDPNGMTNGNDGAYRDEGSHMTLLTNRATALLKPGPMDADIIWLFDLTSGAGIWSHDAAHSSILIHGDYLYLNSGTGVDNTHKKIRTPDAPSLVVLEKRSGKLIARDYAHIAPNIFHSTWCSPSMAEVNGKPLIFFGGGNGVLYAFEPLKAGITRSESERPHPLKEVWRFNFDPDAPKTEVHKFNSNRREGPSDFYGMPVFYRNRIYIAGGGDLWWGKNQAWLKCIDPRRTGDVSKDSLIWSYELQKHVMGTCAISGGTLFLADCGRKLHCLNPETGAPYWTHDIDGECWSSPLVADGKMYLGTRSGAFYIFAATKEKRLIQQVNFHEPISATATAANGAVYIATMSKLLCVKKK
jgi:outer membrane protein assembly factor BamB